MRKTILISLFLLIILTISIYAFTTDSANYKIESGVVSSGAGSINSTNYKTTLGNIIANLVESANYLIGIGLFQDVLLADGQPCTSNSQCAGDYCCSNLCQSTACTTTTTVAPSGAAAGAGAAGGGGGGAAPSQIITEVEKFSVSPNNLKYFLGLGDEEQKTVKVSNTGTTSLDITSDITGINDFVWLSDTDFELNPEEEKDVAVNAIGKKLGSYFGEISFKSNEITKPVSVVVEVESKLVLFDAKLDILSKFKKINLGDNLRMQITLLNVGAPKLVDVVVTYLIKDKLGSIIHEESETFAVDKQRSYEKSIKIPENLAFGDYLAAIEVRYADSFAVSSDIFSVIEEPIQEYPEVLSNIKSRIIFILVLAIIILSLIILVIRKKSGSNKQKIFINNKIK